MPVCQANAGEQMMPDLVVGRQAVGQMYESGARITRLKDPSLSRVAKTDDIAPLGEEVGVMEGETGRPFSTAV